MCNKWVIGYMVGFPKIRVPLSVRITVIRNIDNLLSKSSSLMVGQREPFTIKAVVTVERTMPLFVANLIGGGAHFFLSDVQI